MKRVVLVIGIFISAIAMSCDYDDSNDIDIINPNDTTQTSIKAENSLR
ncbi:hypothetical protein [Maribacter sp. 2210JD10-5]